VEKEQRFYPLLLLMMMMMMMVLEIRSSEYIDSLKATHTNIEKRERESDFFGARSRRRERVEGTRCHHLKLDGFEFCDRGISNFRERISKMIKANVWFFFIAIP